MTDIPLSTDGERSGGYLYKIINWYNHDKEVVSLNKQSNEFLRECVFELNSLKDFYTEELQEFTKENLYYIIEISYICGMISTILRLRGKYGDVIIKDGQVVINDDWLCIS
jgi:hypothetical protein